MDSSEHRTLRGTYVICVEFGDGRKRFPARIVRDGPDWEADLDEACAYYQALHAGEATIAVEYGRELAHMGIPDTASVQSWSEVKRELANARQAQAASSSPESPAVTERRGGAGRPIPFSPGITSRARATFAARYLPGRCSRRVAWLVVALALLAAYTLVFSCEASVVHQPTGARSKSSSGRLGLR